MTRGFNRSRGVVVRRNGYVADDRGRRIVVSRNR